MESETEFKDLREIVLENNKILKRMQRNARFGRFFSLLKWAIYITLIVLSVRYIQPYLEQLQTTYSNIQETAGEVNEFKANASTNFGEFMDFFKSESATTTGN